MPPRWNAALGVINPVYNVSATKVNAAMAHFYTVGVCYMGSSLRAYIDLAEEFGYVPVAHRGDWVRAQAGRRQLRGPLQLA